MRTNQKTVTFTRPFTLSSVGPQPAGTYLVVAAEESIEGRSVTVNRRPATMMHLPADLSPSQTCHVVEVDPEELAAALEANGDGEDTPLEGLVSAAAKHPEALNVEHPRTSIRIVLRYGIWQLTRSGSFYGDYLTQQEAFDAASDIAGAAAARGERIDVQLDEDLPPS
jgi:hypothetical protein